MLKAVPSKEESVGKKAGNLILDHCIISANICNFFTCSYNGFHIHILPSKMYPLNNVLPPNIQILRVVSHDFLIHFSHIAIEWLAHS